MDKIDLILEKFGEMTKDIAALQTTVNSMDKKPDHHTEQLKNLPREVKSISSVVSEHDQLLNK